MQENGFYRFIYNLYSGILPESLAWLAFTLTALTMILIVLNTFLGMATMYIWVERRVIGRFQTRIGPNRVGPFGVLQSIADAIKLLTKEAIIPKNADAFVFNIAPVLLMVPTILVLAVIPFGRGSFIADLNIGVLYVVAVSGISTLAILMAGYGSANKYAMFGSMRAVAQLVSYEIPIVLSLMAVVILTGTMSLNGIVEAQRIPFILVQPLGFLVFIAGISAELNRAPFDLVEAESELIAGYHTEYSGMKFGTFQLAEFANALIASALITVLFLQGWKWVLLPSHLWFLLKVFAIAFVFIWARATLPRFRIDQILAIAWKFLLPLSLVNVAMAAIEVLIWPTLTIPQLLLMTGINWVVAAAAIFVFGKLVAKDMGVRRQPNVPVIAEATVMEVR